MIGSSCETEVSTDCGLTRLPTCVVACPATPPIRERTWVKPRLSLAVASGGLVQRATACLRRYDRGLGLLRLLLVIVELALRDGARLRQRCVALEVDLRKPQLGLGLAELALPGRPGLFLPAA